VRLCAFGCDGLLGIADNEGCTHNPYNLDIELRSCLQQMSASSDFGMCMPIPCLRGCHGPDNHNLRKRRIHILLSERWRLAALHVS
jgi:hypothetical protein